MDNRVRYRPIWGLLVVTTILAGAWASWSQAQVGSATQAEPGAAAVATPKIIAIKFHADWCGYCKAMGGVYEEMQAKFDQQPVLWITLDQTRENGRKQSEYLARALNMSDIWAENGGKTGFILLVNAESREVVGKLTHEQTLKEMGAQLVEAVDKASS